MSTLSSALVIPDTLLAKEATDLLREHSTDLLFNHSMRVYFFAAEQGRQRKLRFDPELLYVAAAFHDFGLLKKFSSPDERFEVDGANAARQFLSAHKVPEGQIQIAWEAIALHTTPGVTQYMRPEVALLYSGVGLDVLGKGFDQFPSELREKIVAEYPREHFKERFVQEYFAGFAHKPGTTYGTVNASICERLIPGYQAPNACDVIAASPFPDSDNLIQRVPRSEAMAEMKAMEFTDQLNLQPVRRPVPEPQAGEILIQVSAAGVTPTEKHWYPTSHNADGTARSKAIPGHEFSGTVAGLGAGALGYRLGDAVFGLNDWFAEGATAEFCITRPSNLSLKPFSLSHVEAASAPIGLLTGWQGLHVRAKLQKGERVLVHGGAGAVGLFAVQLAKSKGAYVIATSSKANIDFVKQLGADEVIDYRERRFEEAGLVDVIFDTVGGETLDRSWDLLKPRGRLVTIAADAESSTDPRVKSAFFIVEQDGEQLAGLGELFDSGELKAFVKTELPMEEADHAYSGLIAGNPGKLIIRTE